MSTQSVPHICVLRAELMAKQKDAKLKYGKNWQKHAAEADHIDPLSRIVKRNENNKWVTTEDIKDIANQDDNYQVMSRSANQNSKSMGKGGSTQSEWAKDGKRMEGMAKHAENGKSKKEIQQEVEKTGLAAEKRNDIRLKKAAVKNVVTTGHEAGIAGAQNAGITTLTMFGIMNLVSVIKDVIERNVEVEGFAFRCEPAELGWVDKEAVFHAGKTVMSGKIIAEKNGITAELSVSTRPVQDIHIAADEILIDSVRPYRINLEGNINGQVYTLDPAAFAWTSSNPSCCRIENGILKGIENGETSLVGTLDTITVGLKVTVEVTPETLVHENFSDLSDFPLSSTVSNTLSISHEELPTGWPDGAVLQFDQKTGRNPYVEMGKSYRLYSLPDSISLQLNLSKEALAAIKHIRFDFTHKNGKSYWQPEYIPSDTGDQTIVWAFSKNGIAFPTEDFPLTLEAIRFVLNPGSRSEITIPLRELKAYYPVKANSAINNVYTENNVAWITAEGELRLHYNLQQTGSADISIWTTAGQQISEYISNRELPGTYTYNISDRFLSPGIYILTIRANGKNQSLKFRVK